MLWGDKQKHNIHEQGGHVMKYFDDEINFSRGACLVGIIIALRWGQEKPS